MTTTKNTKRVRASQVRVGHVIDGAPVARITGATFHQPGSVPVYQITFHFPASTDPDAPALAVYGSSEWVTISR